MEAKHQESCCRIEGLPASRLRGVKSIPLRHSVLHLQGFSARFRRNSARSGPICISRGTRVRPVSSRNTVGTPHSQSRMRSAELVETYKAPLAASFRRRPPSRCDANRCRSSTHCSSRTAGYLTAAVSSRVRACRTPVVAARQSRRTSCRIAPESCANSSLADDRAGGVAQVVEGLNQ